MNHALMPNTVAAPASTIKIHRFSCTSGQMYRRRDSRTITSVAIVQVGVHYAQIAQCCRIARSWMYVEGKRFDSLAVGRGEVNCLQRSVYRSGCRSWQ